MLPSKKYTKVEFPWHIPNDGLRQVFESSKTITRRLWTTHNNVVLELFVEISPSIDNKWANFGITYIDGPSEQTYFQCSIIVGRTDGTYYEHFLKGVDMDDYTHSLNRGETTTHDECKYIAANDNNEIAYRQLRLKVFTPSFDLDIPAERPDAQDWMIELFEDIGSEDSKHSDVRLICGDDHTFYCHRFVLSVQSDAMDAMFRNATTEEEKNGTFRLSAWSTEEFREILAYFYGVNLNLESSTIQQLMNIYYFGEQQGLDRLKKYVITELWRRIPTNPNVCAEIARFADLHMQNGLKPLKYRCFDVLVENYSWTELNGDEIFKVDTPSGIDNGEPPPSKKMRGSDDVDTKEKKDEVAARLKNELLEYLGGRIEGVLIL